jgi:GNAT superfamily N-acetyltransferase
MHIRQLDPVGNAADLAAVLRAYQAAGRADKPGFPSPGAAALLLRAAPGYQVVNTVLGAFASPDAVEAQALAIHGYEQTRNLDLAWMDLHVPAEARARGADTALLEEAARFSAELGRTRLALGLSEAADPADFAERHGGKHTDTAIRSSLDLRTIDERFEQWAAPSEKNAAYTFVSWDRCPEEFAASYCAALDAMADQPLGEFEFEWARHEVDRLRFAEDRGARFGLRRYTLAALDPDGEVAGFTEIWALPDEPESVEIHSTGVARQHRGHGLGLRLKAAATLWLAEDRPSTRWITTYNNDGNSWMLAVNRTLGYRAAEKWLGYEFAVGAGGSIPAAGHTSPAE